MRPPNPLLNFDDPAAHRALGWLLEGRDQTYISEGLRKEYPKRKPADVLESVLEYLATVGDRADIARGWAIEATRVVYQKLIEAEDYAAALAAIRQLMQFTHPRTSKKPPPSSADPTPPLKKLVYTIPKNG